MVRCFIGIFIPKNVKNEIVAIQNELKKLPMDCKFVEFDNLHLCLSFLGEVSDQEINFMKEKLGNTAKSVEKFDVNIRGLKLIPNERYVRVMVLDVFDKNNMLIALGKMIQNDIGGDAKPPHITLCRIKNIVNKPLFLENVKNLKMKFSDFTVTNICLIKSELSRQGPIYSSLSEASLG